MFKPGILKPYSNAFVLSLRMLDLAAILLAAWIAYLWLSPAGYLQSGVRNMTAIAMLVAAILFDRFGLYRPWRGMTIAAEIKTMSGAWFATWVIAAAIHVIATPAVMPVTAWLTGCILIGWTLLTFLRLNLRLTLRVLRAHGFNQRHVALVGSTESARRIADQLAHAPWAGLRVIGYFTDSEKTEIFEDFPRLGVIADLAAHAEVRSIDQVWICLPLRAEELIRRVLYELRYATVDVRYAPDLDGLRLLNYSMSEVAGIPLLNLTQTPLSGLSRLVKEFEDRCIAALALMLISPLMALIALGVKLSSSGPILYTQDRVSWNNQPFKMLKFRTMPTDAEEESGPRWATPGDGRATRFGAFLRRTSLDELPQFINVLKGEMSIVGPRPERPCFVQQFKDRFPGYMKKHLVKGGITGWAQVHGWRGDTDLAKRLEFDLYYIEHWSLWLDMKIMALTLARGFNSRNAY